MASWTRRLRKNESAPTRSATALLWTSVAKEEDGVVKIPAHLSLEEGTTLPCAGVTVWNAMTEHAKLIAGQTVLQGTGGVSIFARMMGIQVIITSSSDDKLARAKALGANHGINYKTTPEWEKAALGALTTLSRSAVPRLWPARSSIILILTVNGKANPRLDASLLQCTLRSPRLILKAEKLTVIIL